jgi:hypothetical protein
MTTSLTPEQLAALVATLQSDMSALKLEANQREERMESMAAQINATKPTVDAARPPTESNLKLALYQGVPTLNMVSEQELLAQESARIQKLLDEEAIWIYGEALEQESPAIKNWRIETTKALGISKVFKFLGKYWNQWKNCIV